MYTVQYSYINLWGLKKTPRVAVTWLSYIYGPELIVRWHITCAGIAHLCLTRLHYLNLGNLYLEVQYSRPAYSLVPMLYASVHGLINYIDTKAKCRHLKNLSVKEFCGRCLSVRGPPPLHTVYVFTFYSFNREGEGGRAYQRDGGATAHEAGSNIPKWLNCISSLWTLLNTCRKVPLQVNSFRWWQIVTPYTTSHSSWNRQSSSCHTQGREKKE
jgi:hypothetical protein